VKGVLGDEAYHTPFELVASQDGVIVSALITESAPHQRLVAVVQTARAEGSI